jgi:phosphatidylglycerol---prolipoprotein diacylglyceryl transferase
MHPDLFHIGNFAVATYGVTFGLAIFVGVMLSYRRAGVEGMDQEKILTAMILGVVGIIVGSKLAHIAVTWDWYMAKPSRFYNLRRGHVYYGGYVGSVLLAVLYMRWKRQRVLAALDIWLTYSMVGLGFHRMIGCLSAGCCHGRPTTMPWGIVFPAASQPARAFGQVPLHPTQIYEALLAFFIVGFLLWWRTHRKKVDGELFLLQMTIYAAGRFVIEFYRGDLIRGMWGPLSTSQWFSLATLGVIVPLGLYLRKQRALALARPAARPNAPAAHRPKGKKKKGKK